MISSSRSTLYRFLSLYAALYAGFGVQSPYLPILLDTRHLSPETIALALAAGTAMRLTAAPALARLADRFDAPKAMLALCSAAAGLIGLGYLSAQGAWALIALGVMHTAALAPLPPLSDTLALGAAAPTGSGGMPKWKFHYGWLRGCGSAAFVVGLVMSGQAIGHFGIAVIVWLNAALLLAASPVALRVPQLLASGEHSRAIASQARGLLALLRLPLYRKMVLLAALILGSHAMHDSFAMIRWSRAGISPGTSGILWSLSVAAEVVVFVVVGRPLLDRIGPAGAAMLSAGAGVVRWAVMAETAWLPALALIEPLHGLTFALLHLTCMRLLAQCVPRHLEATALTIYGTVGIGVATALLTLACGPIFERFGAHGFWAMAALCAAALPLTRTLREPTADLG
ncbi:MAG: MFS transporter [Stellaceae bacterium]|jgi:PPP family 3-phenylpropionic acid transporter